MAWENTMYQKGIEPTRSITFKRKSIIHNKVCGAEDKPKVEEVREDNPNASPVEETLDSEKSNSVSYSLRAFVKINSRIFFVLIAHICL